MTATDHGPDRRPDHRPAYRAAYRLVRTRVDTLLRSASDADLGRRVPCCPAWTVTETLAHLVGVCSDILAGNADITGSPGWTAAQVAARREQPVGALLDEWATTGEQVAAALDGRSALGQVVMDSLTHEHDLRLALGVPPASTADGGEDPALAPALGWLLHPFGRHLDAVGAPALRLVLTPDGAEAVLGSGEPAATLRAGRFDVLRTLTGRRTPAQAAALAWDADPARWLAALAWGPFTPPAVAVEPSPAGR